MPITAEKRKFLVEILGEEEAEKMLDRLTQLETELKQAGIQYKEAGTAQAGDVLAELLVAVEAGQTTLDEIRREISDRVADAVERVMKPKSFKLLERSKDVPNSLGPTGEKDTHPIARYARLLGKGQKAAGPALKDDGNPITRYAQGLVQGQVEREGG